MLVWLWPHRTRPRQSCRRSRPPGYRLGLRAGRRGGSCSGRAWWEGTGAPLRLETHESLWKCLAKNSLCGKWREVKRSSGWWSMKGKKRALIKYVSYVFKGKPRGRWSRPYRTGWRPHRSYRRSRPCRRRSTSEVCTRCCCRWTHQPGRRRHLQSHRTLLKLPSKRRKRRFFYIINRIFFFFWSESVCPSSLHLLFVSFCRCTITLGYRGDKYSSSE